MEVINHSKIGASSCHRFWECAGSIALGDKAKREGAVKETSRFAMEGTAAHLLADICLKDGSRADRHLDVGLGVEDDYFFVTQNMADAVQVYLDKVRELLCEYKDAEYGFEKKFHLTNIHPEAYGTNDAYIYIPEEERLIVIDYKHGKGIVVEVEGNKQLLYYALGAKANIKGKIKRIKLMIVQPRAKHKKGVIREITYTAKYLEVFEKELKEKILATEQPILELKAGAHCKFCPAILICSIAELNTWRGNTTVSVADAIEAFN